MLLPNVTDYVPFVEKFSRILVFGRHFAVDIEELIQESLIILLTTNSFDPEKVSAKGVKAWIARIVYTTCVKLYNKRKKAIQVPISDYDIPVLPQQEDRVHLNELIQSISLIKSPYRRKALELQINGGPVMIAQSTHLYLARKELRQILGLSPKCHMPV